MQQTPLEFDVPAAQQSPLEQLPDEHALLLPTGHAMALATLAAQVVPLQYWLVLLQHVVPQAVCELLHAPAHVVPLQPVDGQVFVG
ncbi:MAG: hypothetical protein ACJ8F1_02025 [Polyangia bacterium]